MGIKEDVFVVKNDLVNEALFGEIVCGFKGLPGCSGYVNSDQHQIGKAFLSFCYSRIFNIHRVYGYEDAYISDHKRHFRESFNGLTEQKIIVAERELEELYCFTQKFLLEKGLVVDDKIHLVRALRPFEIESLTDQFRDGKKKIKVKSGILSSYGHYTDDFRYGSCVTIHRMVPVEDIVIFYKALAYPGETCYEHGHGYEDEVWVKNNNPLGYIEIAREDIHIYNKDGRFDRDYPDRRSSERYYRTCGVDRYETSARMFEDLFCPCTDDRMIRFLMKMKKYI